MKKVTAKSFLFSNVIDKSSYLEKISFFILLIILFTTPLSAMTTMTNDSYKVEMGNFDAIGATSVSNSQYKLGFTSGEVASGLYTGTNYKVRAGFKYIKSIIPFSFAVSSQNVNFGTLTPGIPLTRSHTLSVSNGSAYGYTVTSSEDHALRIFAYGIDIPDTTCDDGTCTQTTAAAWTSNTTYGFGYRCDNVTGSACPSAFSTGTYFKQFANLENDEVAQTVMSGTEVGRTFEVTITYKVNIPSSQTAGLYRNMVQYIATPSI